MTKLLKEMYLNLSDSVKEGVGAKEREQSYQKQLDFYRQLYECDSENKEQGQALLVAARCLISISRSLCENEQSAESLNFARDELFKIKGVFEKEQNTARRQIRQIVNKRIARLSKNYSEEFSDSFLFLYMALLQL